MEINELLKKIDSLKEEIKEQYAVLGEQYFEKEFDNARANYSLVVNRITECKNSISDIRKQINIIKGIVICDHCGAEVKNTYTFCQECGNKIKGGAKEVPDGFVLCGNCNTVMEAGSKFCVCCGQRLNVNDQSSAVKEPVVQAIEEVTLVKPVVEKKVVQSIPPKRQKECPQCKELINEDDTFCISCGAIFSIPEMDMDDFDDNIDDNVDNNTENNIDNSVDEAADMFRECPKCGHKMSSKDSFCIRCGYRIV